MILVTTTPKFDRSFARLIDGSPALESIFRRKLSMFVHDPFDPSLATHKLGGNMRELWSFSLTPKLRIVFSFEEGNTVILVNVGSHDRVY